MANDICFTTNIINIYGDQGKVWLAALPDIVKSIADKYGLSDLMPVENLSYNYVLTGLSGDQPIILKLSLDADGLQREAVALKAFAGFGAVKVLAADDGFIVLERAIPGVSLKSYFPKKDTQAIQIVCDVMQRLHQTPLPNVSAFPHIKDWLNTLDQEWDIPTHTLAKARQLRDYLLESSAEPALLHGDLHHDNILQSRHSTFHNSGGDDWVVIDPKGVIGEKLYEVAAFIRNPIPELLTSEARTSIISNRITSFAEILGLPERRILDWCFVQAVLAWSWALEDGCDVNYFKRLTEVFDKVKL